MEFESRIAYKNYTTNDSESGVSYNDQPNVEFESALYSDQPFFEYARLIWIIFSPIIIVMGLLGNVFVVMVLQRPKFRRSSASLILRSLALTDTAMLLLSCLPRLVAFILRVDLHEIFEATCRGEYITTYFLTDLSSWVLVLVTVERAIAVVLPLKSKQLITRRVTFATLGAVTSSFFVLNLPIPWLLRLREEPTGDVCEPYPEYKFMWEKVMMSLNLTISSFIPFTLISVINFIGWITLLTNRRRCAEYTAASIPHQNRWKISSVTRMLICIDLVFLFTTMPIALFRVFFPDSMYHPDPEVRAELIFYRAVLELTLYCNSCANFYLYCLAGQRFRNELRALLGLDRIISDIRLVQPKFRNPKFRNSTSTLPPSDNKEF